MAQDTKPLGERLVDLGVITREELTLALREQKRTGEHLGEILKQLGFGSEEVIAEALSRQAGVQHVNLDETEVDPVVVNLVPEDFARQRKVVPIGQNNRSLTVAMANIFDVVTIDELQRMTDSFVEVVSATESAIDRALDKYYGGTAIQVDETIEEYIRQAELRGAEETQEELAEEAPIIKLVDQIIFKAIKEGATDVHLEPEERSLRSRYRIDGILRPGPFFPKALQPAIVARVKILSNLNIAEQRLPQDGKIRFFMGKKRVNIRVSSFPTLFGEAVVMRILASTHLIRSLEELGFSTGNLVIFRRAIKRPSGIILVTGPTGSGKTTTLYSALSNINSVELNVCTVEDPIEYEMSSIRQSQVNVQAGFTFAAGLRALLRQDPDVILVGEMRDYETVELAMRAALTGHMVFSTLHTSDAATSVTRLRDMGVEPFLIASTVALVIAQRLVRKICPYCKEEEASDPLMVEQLGIQDFAREATFYRGAGCRACSNTGYSGRTAIFEILPMTNRVRDLIMKDAPSNVIFAAAKEEGMSGMFEEGLKKVKEGVTTIDEVVKVVRGSI